MSSLEMHHIGLLFPGAVPDSMAQAGQTMVIQHRIMSLTAQLIASSGCKNNREKFIKISLHPNSPGERHMYGFGSR